jgi:hypothetical protein
MLLRYSILWHKDIDEPHYDLMFETSPGSALSTWRSPIWPITQTTSLIKLRDHRPAFLTYQGTLGGDRGSVIQVAAGTCEIEIDGQSGWIIRWPDSVHETLKLAPLQDDLWEAEPMLSK